MSISQFFILSPRGDVIISKDYRGDSPAGLHETFFRKVKFWDRGDAPPVFQVDGITPMGNTRNGIDINNSSTITIGI